MVGEKELHRESIGDRSSTGNVIIIVWVALSDQMVQALQIAPPLISVSLSLSS